MIIDVVVTCGDGAEAVLEQELRALGMTDLRRDRGAILACGTMEQAARICLWSRIASRVLLPLFDVESTSTDELYDAAVEYPWGDVLDPRGTIAVHTTAMRDVKIHTQYVSLKLKDAVVDHCREHHGVRPNVSVDRPDVPLQVHASARGFQVSIDLSGDSLHKRGYRVAMTEAPLKETLAATLLMQAGWPSSDLNAFVDPMCGSGTFLIEAAWMSADIAPGINRDYYGFMGFSAHDPVVWKAIRDEAEERRHEGLRKALPSIFGFDASEEALLSAQRNVDVAGVGKLITLQRKALYELRKPITDSPLGNGLLVCNPPYGERLGEKETMRDLYRALGRVSSEQFSGWQACVLASDIQHADALGFSHRATERLHNGALIVYARHGDIPAASSREVTRFQEGTGTIPPEAEAFANRLRKNLKAAHKHAETEKVFCYRVYDADMPEFNLALDVYEGQLHVQEYAPPKSVDPEKAEARFKLALIAIRHVFGLHREQVFIKVRARQKGNQQYEKKGSKGKFIEVREGNAWLLVNMTDYLDTGLFLDHRPLRLRMASEAKGKHFLNLFAYTGVASVHAALAGAASTVTVDLSPTYLAWAERNFALNGIPPENHYFEQADSIQWLRDCQEKFDLIFLDPPTFSNSKRTPGVFDVQEDHVELIVLCMRLLTPGGVLYFSNNFRKFKLDTDALARFRIEDISPSTIGFDFARDPGIHKCWRITAGD
ncbi:MAG TPA: bifunctional 23S rRNA (guanine(2069)-N(7))-methyltransferase RlmK/23S rRNA (guanine(2445)-N(2))-methyltransferase RlmL [Moraxellaceae bacterium]|nr:bifunctional 23S rRNA (guanine(2069)-N(7))-methyltransferase RlmK/23S rRNA (guanine(2445)-N(2))-methyltransferase RlmL [Moraxellaceae bacterium]